MNQSRFKRPESVLVLICTDSGLVLLLERKQPAGFWQSVTGSLRWGEDSLQAAVREVLEETGLEVQGCLDDCEITNRYPIHPAWRHRYAPDVEVNTEHVYRVVFQQCPEIQLNTKEHQSFRWLPSLEASQVASSGTDRQAILQFLVHC